MQENAQALQDGMKQAGPPDLEKIARDIYRWARDFSPGKPGPWGKHYGVGLWFLMCLLYFLGGVHLIGEGECGVVTRLGRFHREESAGLCWRALGLERLYRVDVGRMRTLSTSGVMLTRDENVVQVDVCVQYTIEDPQRYLFRLEDPHESLREAVDSALRTVVGHTSMDEILTTGRAQLREETGAQLRQILAPYGSGLVLQDVNVQSTRAPEAVKAAFDDAISAQEDEQRFLREAEAYAREREPQARGEAKRLEEEALADRERMILKAREELARFQQLQPLFARSPEFVKKSLYLEMLGPLFAQTPKIFMQGRNDQVLLYERGQDVKRNKK